MASRWIQEYRALPGYSELLVQLFQETADALLHFIYPLSDVGIALRRVGVLVILHCGFCLGWSVELLMQGLALRWSCCTAILVLRVAGRSHWLVLLGREAGRW